MYSEELHFRLIKHSLSKCTTWAYIIKYLGSSVITSARGFIQSHIEWSTVEFDNKSSWYINCDYVILHKHFWYVFYKFDSYVQHSVIISHLICEMVTLCRVYLNKLCKIQTFLITVGHRQCNFVSTQWRISVQNVGNQWLTFLRPSNAYTLAANVMESPTRWLHVFIDTALQKFGITLVSLSTRGKTLLRWPFFQEYHTEYFQISYDKC